METFGGICGRSYITIRNCYNKGTTVDNTTGTTGHAGGIVGYAFSSAVYNSYNTGAITGTGYAGGIVGYGNINSGDSYGGLAMRGCYNIGIIKSTASTSKAGGICGHGIGTSSYNGCIEYCYNYQIVTSSGTTSAGGIIGYAGYMSVKNCRNDWKASLPNASSTSYPGAIIGYWNGSGNIMSNVTWRSDLMTYSVGSPSNKRSTSGTTVTSKASNEEILSLVNGYNNGYVADTQNINGGYPILAWQAN